MRHLRQDKKILDFLCFFDDFWVDGFDRRSCELTMACEAIDVEEYCGGIGGTSSGVSSIKYNNSSNV